MRKQTFCEWIRDAKLSTGCMIVAWGICVMVSALVATAKILLALGFWGSLAFFVSIVPVILISGAVACIPLYFVWWLFVKNQSAI